MLELVGTPYNENNNGGFNCYGMVRHVLNNECGMDLPEAPPSAIAWPRYVKIYKPPLPKLAVFDIIMFAEIIPGLVNHIGIVATDNDFIHCTSKCGGVVCEPIDRYADKIMGMGRPLL